MKRPATRAASTGCLVAALLASLAVVGPVAAQSTQNGTDAAPRMKPAERLFRYLDEKVHVVPGRGLGRIVIGTPLAAVVRAWGAPARSDRSGLVNRETSLLYDAGIDAWIIVRGDQTVETLGFEGRTGFSTVEGVRFGMPRHQVALTYGPPVETREGAYQYPERGIAFNFRSGTVYQIEVFAPRARAQ